MTNVEKAKFDPASFFKRPADVVHDDTLTHHDKIDILHRWAYDEREKAVAEEENMQSSNDLDRSNRLTEILQCLLELGIDTTKQSPPTKQR